MQWRRWTCPGTASRAIPALRPRTRRCRPRRGSTASESGRCSALDRYGPLAPPVALPAVALMVLTSSVPALPSLPHRAPTRRSRVDQPPEADRAFDAARRANHRPWPPCPRPRVVLRPLPAPRSLTADLHRAFPRYHRDSLRAGGGIGIRASLRSSCSKEHAVRVPPADFRKSRRAPAKAGQRGTASFRLTARRRRMRTLVYLAILTAVAGTAPAPLAAQDHDFNIHANRRARPELQRPPDDVGRRAGRDVGRDTDGDRQRPVGARAEERRRLRPGIPGRSDFSISACKAVARPIGRDATAALENPSSACGQVGQRQRTDSDDWVVSFIVDAPANGNVEVETTNGPVHVEGIPVRRRRGPSTVRSGCSTSAGARPRKRSTGPSRTKDTTATSNCTPRTVPSRSGCRAIAGIPGR